MRIKGHNVGKVPGTAPVIAANNRSCPMSSSKGNYSTMDSSCSQPLHWSYWIPHQVALLYGEGLCGSEKDLDHLS